MWEKYEDSPTSEDHYHSLTPEKIWINFYIPCTDNNFHTYENCFCLSNELVMSISWNIIGFLRYKNLIILFIFTSLIRVIAQTSKCIINNKHVNKIIILNWGGSLDVAPIKEGLLKARWITHEKMGTIIETCFY